MPDTDGTLRGRGSSLRTNIGRDSAQPEDYELSRLNRRDADLAHDLAGVDDVGRVRLSAAHDVLRVSCGLTSERAVAPTALEEVLHFFAQILPQSFVVRLGDRPARALVNR